MQWGVELGTEGIVDGDDVLLEDDRRATRIEEVADLGWAFAIACEPSPYASYEVLSAAS